MTESVESTAPPSLWEDFLDIFYAPRSVFERRRGAGYGLVLLILTVVLTALFFASMGPLADAYAAEFRRGMEGAGAAGQQMTAEQLAQAERVGTIFGTLAMLIGFPLGVIIIGFFLWALGKMFGFVGTVSAAILIVTYAQFPRLVQSVVMLLQGLILNPDSLAATTFGPARFMDPESASALMLAMMMRLDLFYIWSTALIAIGAEVIGRIPRSKAILLAVLVWVVGAIPTVLGALASGAAG